MYLGTLTLRYLGVMIIQDQVTQGCYVPKTSKVQNWRDITGWTPGARSRRGMGTIVEWKVEETGSDSTNDGG